MKKQAIQRGLFGFPVGISIGYIITIISSFFGKDGGYSPVIPAFIDTVGSEIGAVALQAMLCGIIGASFAMASLIWERENWSIAKQTGIYFFVTAITMLPIAYFAHWMEHSLAGFFGYAIIFLAIFVIMWVIQYYVWKFKINGINSKMKNNNKYT